MSGFFKNLLLLSAAFCLVCVGWSFAKLPGLLDSHAHNLEVQLLDTRSELNTKADTVIKIAQQTAYSTNRVLDKNLVSANNSLGATERTLLEQTGKLVVDLNRNSEGLVASAGSLATSGQHIAQLADTTSTAVAEISPEVVKLTRDARLTTAEAGRAAGEIQRATPMLLTDLGDITANLKETTAASSQASKATATVMNNLATATKPLPSWIRWAPPLIQTAASASLFFH